MNDDTTMLKYVSLAMIIAFLCVLLFGCSKTVYVPVESIRTEYKDRIIKDTTSSKELVNIKDSIIFRDSTVTIVDDKGNILRTEIYKWRDSFFNSNRLLEIWKAKYDSLRYIKQDTIRVPFPVEKQLTKWQQFKMDIGGISIGVICVLLIIVIWLIFKKR